MSALPDPLSYCVSTLEQLGGLVERSGGSASALLPAAVASRLGVPDDIDLGDLPGAVACGLGSPMLEVLVGIGRAEVPLASASASLLPPNPRAVRSIAEAWPIRNGVSSVLEVGVVDALYLVAAVAWTVEADERYEGIVVATVDASTGGVPAVPLHLDPELRRQGAEPVPIGFDPGVAAGWARRAAAPLVEAAVAAPVALTARRRARDRDRLTEYYASLVQEARAPRRRVDAAAIAAKVKHVVSERDNRLAGLAHRYTARIAARPAALLVLCVRAGSARLRVRRRKREGEIVLRLPPGARTFDRLPCDGCRGWLASGPVLCDEHLHVLCEACAPSASGRPRCPACAVGGAPGTAAGTRASASYPPTA